MLVSGVTNPETILSVHRGLIRAILEWGAILYSGAAKKILNRLDTQLYVSLRLAMGLMKSTPTSILLAESGEATLSIRREAALYRNAIRLTSWFDNPVYPRIKMLKEKAISNSYLPKYVRETALVTHIGPIGEIFERVRKPKRSSYFDHSWVNIGTDLEKNVH